MKYAPVRMIELRNVSKSYDNGATLAVAGVSLKIEKGELLGLIGESGCGKTTTLKMINRLEEADAGQILVGGRDVMDRNPQALRRNIGYVFQGIGLFPHYTVMENVAAVPRLLQWTREETERRCREALELVGLPAEEYGERNPMQLSGGQQQRVGVARALAASPEVVLMDEPFGALDPVTRGQLRDEFRAIQRKLDLTVILVTHDMMEALLLADRIAVMKEGEVLQVGTPHELLMEPEHGYVSEMVEMPRQEAVRLDRLIREESARP